MLLTGAFGVVAAWLCVQLGALPVDLGEGAGAGAGAGVGSPGGAAAAAEAPAAAAGQTAARAEREGLWVLRRRQVLLLPLQASAALLLLYLVDLSVIMAWLFAVAGWLCIELLGRALALKACALCSRGTPSPRLRALLSALTGALSASTAGVWLYGRRRWGWTWALQDLMGIAMCGVLLACVQLSSLDVGAILSAASVAYDVTFVYLVPLFFGTKVMERVAVGADGRPAVPMVFRIPSAAGGGFELLGFGDVLVPGLLLCLARRWDSCGADGRRRRFPLLWRCLLAYGAGLQAASSVADATDASQPALLYVMPLTFAALCASLWAEGDLRRRWSRPPDERLGETAPLLP